MQDTIPRTLSELTEILREELNQELHAMTDAKVDKIKALLGAYVSNEDDWKRYCHFDPHRYTRNLVDTGNGNYNLIVLCWDKNQTSPIHDHPNSHCLVKMLDGELTESLYDWPNENGPMHLRQESVFYRDQVTYMHDKMGLHRMSNQSNKNVAVSLHLYSPPYQMCKTFCETSGEARCSGNITFYSRNAPQAAT
ncbi:RmlC-like cupin domain-containing protein [Gorgonomyces haynaldii]|nr:RmlC-like cupin domain-containing protein [Gorgonomyces haynaldii]